MWKTSTLVIIFIVLASASEKRHRNEKSSHYDRHIKDYSPYDSYKTSNVESQDHDEHSNKGRKELLYGSRRRHVLIKPSKNVFLSEAEQSDDGAETRIRELHEQLRRLHDKQRLHVLENLRDRMFTAYESRVGEGQVTQKPVNNEHIKQLDQRAQQDPRTPNLAEQHPRHPWESTNSGLTGEESGSQHGTRQRSFRRPLGEEAISNDDMKPFRHMSQVKELQKYYLQTRRNKRISDKTLERMRSNPEEELSQDKHEPTEENAAPEINEAQTSPLKKGLHSKELQKEKKTVTSKPTELSEESLPSVVPPKIEGLADELSSEPKIGGVAKKFINEKIILNVFKDVNGNLKVEISSEKIPRKKENEDNEKQSQEKESIAENHQHRTTDETISSEHKIVQNSEPEGEEQKDPKVQDLPVKPPSENILYGHIPWNQKTAENIHRIHKPTLFDPQLRKLHLPKPDHVYPFLHLEHHQIQQIDQFHTQDSDHIHLPKSEYHYPVHPSTSYQYPQPNKNDKTYPSQAEHAPSTKPPPSHPHQALNFYPPRFLYPGYRPNYNFDKTNQYYQWPGSYFENNEYKEKQYGPENKLDKLDRRQSQQMEDVNNEQDTKEEEVDEQKSKMKLLHSLLHEGEVTTMFKKNEHPGHSNSEHKEEPYQPEEGSVRVTELLVIKEENDKNVTSTTKEESLRNLHKTVKKEMPKQKPLEYYFEEYREKEHGCEKLTCPIDKCILGVYKYDRYSGCPTCECCEVVDCFIYCEHGYEADEYGCPTCACAPPIDENDG